MSEYEILTLHGEVLEAFWVGAQFYASVSFGYIILSYVAVDRLNWKLIIALSAMYVAFAIWMIYGFTTMSYQVIAHKEDLMELHKAGALESRAAISVVETWSPTIAFVSTTFAVWGIFFSALLYLPYNYRRHINANT